MYDELKLLSHGASITGWNERPSFSDALAKLQRFLFREKVDLLSIDLFENVARDLPKGKLIPDLTCYVEDGGPSPWWCGIAFHYTVHNNSYRYLLTIPKRTEEPRHWNMRAAAHIALFTKSKPIPTGATSYAVGLAIAQTFRTVVAARDTV